MDTKALKKLSSRLADLASELDDLVNDDEQSILYVSSERDASIGNEECSAYVVSLDYGAGGDVVVAGEDSLRNLANWLGAKIEGIEL